MKKYLVLCLLCLVSCGSEAAPGDPCQSAEDCPEGSLCLTRRDGFPGGYCSASCETAPCAAGQRCRSIGERALCLVRCRDQSGCRAGYQCFQGACLPRCGDDEACGSGFACQAGVCTERPGAPAGTECTTDGECSSGACLDRRCARACDRDGACAEGETCALDRTATRLRTYCIARRGRAEPLAACTTDSECDRGSCVMGACLLLCQTPQDCAGSERSCSQVPAPLPKVVPASWPLFRACLPRNQNLSVLPYDGALVVPQTARSVLLFTQVGSCDEGFVAGLTSFADPAGRSLYQAPVDTASYYRNVLRSTPDIGCSTLLFSSSPRRAPVVTGAYPYMSAAQTLSGTGVGHEVRAIYKLFDGPSTAGRVPLRIHVTSMSGLPPTCPYRTLTAATAPVQLQVMVQRLKEIYQQRTVGITLDPITFVDSDAPTSVDASDAASLRNVLRIASRRSAGGLDLVLLRTISPNAVLGIAGGIPAAPGIAGTGHTGAVAAVYALCIPQIRKDQLAFANIVAHELGHTLGLWHNRESDGQSDPLGDGSARSESYLQNTSNLMYWNADYYGTQLTDEQGQVMRAMPQVRP